MKHLDILAHILTLEVLPVDQLKVQKMFVYSERRHNRQLQTFIGILNY